MNESAPACSREILFADLLWLLLFGLASSWWCLSAAHALSATFDEPVYLREGLEHWRTGSSAKLMRLGAMPLAIDLQTMPLFLWEKWHGKTLDPLREITWTLPLARSLTLVFWWTLLIYAWRAARDLGGAWAGRLAVALIACEPVFLAHACLATSDVAVTACLLVFFVEFRAHRECHWPKRILLPAALYGVAVLSKASALAFGVVGMMAIEIERLAAAGVLRDWRSLSKWRGHFPIVRSSLIDSYWIVAGGIALTFIYCGSDWAAEPSFVEWAQTLTPGTPRAVMLWISENLCIFSNAGEGIIQQIKHNIRGHGAFLLGREYLRAIWFYFPVALTIKTSLLLLLLPAVIAILCRQALWNWAVLAAAGLWLFSLNSRVQIGVRFMLPLLACLAIGMAVAVIQTGRPLPWRGRRILYASVAAGLLGNAVSSARVWPQALCFTNAIWGGTRHGYLLLSDSNYDWGQGLFELDEWRKSHGVETIDVWYFGLDPRAKLPPFRDLSYHSANWVARRKPAAIAAGKCLAVSTTLLYGTYTRDPDFGREAVLFLLGQEPVGRTTTYLIYDFRKK